jgi:hypothetical protein
MVMIPNTDHMNDMQDDPDSAALDNPAMDTEGPVWAESTENRPMPIDYVLDPLIYKK